MANTGMMNVYAIQQLMPENKRSKVVAIFASNRDTESINECTLNKDCYYCHQSNNHHRSLCLQGFSSENHENANLAEALTDQRAPDSLDTTENVLLSTCEIVLMQTARSEVKKSRTNEKQSVRMLFDSGSHRTYITDSLAKELDVKLGDKSEISLVTFGSEKPKKVQTHTTKLDIILNNGNILTITAHVVPNITGTIHRGP